LIKFNAICLKAGGFQAYDLFERGNDPHRMRHCLPGEDCLPVSDRLDETNGFLMTDIKQMASFKPLLLKMFIA